MPLFQIAPPTVFKKILLIAIQLYFSQSKKTPFLQEDNQPMANNPTGLFACGPESEDWPQ
jgi:hypothetical protein